MGLDMYLYKVRKGAGPGMNSWPENQEHAKDRESCSGAASELGYWRKHNAIHHWFVTEVAGGVDDCQPVKVHPEMLADLHERCRKVLADHDQAGNLLPTQDGFFFGTTDLDEWYFHGVEDTVKILEHTLADPEASSGDYDIYYQASW